MIMKMKKSIIALAWVLMAVLVWSCNDGGETPVNPQQENAVSQNLLVNSNAALNRLRSTGLGGPMGAVFGNTQSESGRSSMKPSDLRMNRSESDTTDFESCLIETWQEDGQGNYEYTLDFGDGCDYYGEWLKGKLTERGFFDENSFQSTSTFENFGGHDWTIDGTETYNGTWVEEEFDGEDDVLLLSLRLFLLLLILLFIFVYFIS